MRRYMRVRRQQRRTAVGSPDDVRRLQAALGGHAGRPRHRHQPAMQQVLVSQDGADTSEIDALIEAGFVISNVTVLDITPLYMTFYVRLWRYQTAEEKQLYPTGTITARSAMPASHPKGSIDGVT